MRGQRGDGSDDHGAFGHWLAQAGQDQFGDCFEIDRVGLDLAPALDAALFGHVGRIQLEKVPPRGQDIGDESGWW